MLTSQAIIPPPPATSAPYPCLYKDVDSGLVVLFTDLHNGTVVVANGEYALGHYDDDWSPCSDRDEWTILPPGTVVTLKVS